MKRYYDSRADIVSHAGPALFWCWYNIVVLTILCFVCVEQPRYRGAERFAMCSTHKFLTVAAILKQVDRGKMSLDRKVTFTRADLLSYAPIAKQHVDAGVMTVDALSAATIGWSDNTADNLLLALIDGPAGWTRYARSLGDSVSRLDRLEPDLNTANPEVQAEILRIMGFWLQLGVAGR